MKKHNNQSTDTNKTIGKVIRLVQKLRPGHIPLILVTRILAAAQPFVTVIFGSIILDALLAHKSAGDIMKTAVIMIVIDGLLSLIHWGLEKLLSIDQSIISNKVQQMICEKTFCIDYDILEKKETLDMITRANEGMISHGDIGNFCNILAYLIQNVCTIVYSLILMIPLFVPVKGLELTGLGAVLNKGYSVLFVAAVMGIAVAVASYSNKVQANLQQDTFEKNVKINRFFGYYLNLVFNYGQGKYIRLYKMQDMIIKEYDAVANAQENIFVSLIRKMKKNMAFNLFCSFLIQSASYLYVGLKAIYSLISVGSTLLYVSAFSNLVQAVGAMLNAYIDINVRSKYLSYFYDYMEIQNKRYEGTIPTEKRDDNEYEIEFRDVSFHYPNSEEMVLSHVNEKIKLGSKMAVVGKNGAGKTTFIKLLCRLYDPTEGQILLNGVDIRYYDFRDYAKLFSVVFQDFNLFSFTVGENVATCVDYDEKKVLECIDKAGFGKRLQEMPEGIRTYLYKLEEEGIEISGGEAQKLAIARALYKDAPWVILDEPTSALDPISEYEIYSHFDELVKDKTAIYISHRMSSCRFCENIFVFDNGKVVQRGSHDELMEQKDGLYHSLWNAQAQYYQMG